MLNYPDTFITNIKPGKRRCELIKLDRTFVWPALIGFAILIALWFFVNPLQDKIFTNEEFYSSLGVLAAMIFFLVTGLMLARGTKWGQAIPFVDSTKPWDKYLVIKVLSD